MLTSRVAPKPLRNAVFGLSHSPSPTLKCSRTLAHARKSHCRTSNLISTFRTSNRQWLSFYRSFSSKIDPSTELESIKGQIERMERVIKEFEAAGISPTEYEIDRSGMSPFGTRHTKGLSWKELEEKKGKRSDLVKQLHAIIETRGPMSMATFMNYALTHPLYGYYMNSDMFGKQGDFTTAPEISQMFGELIGIWCLAMWQHLGRPKTLHIIELGPGRGTLASDLLNATKDLNRDFFKAVHMHFVEVSPHLRRLQAQKFKLVYPVTVNPESVAAIRTPKGLEEHTEKLATPSEGAVEIQRPNIAEETNDEYDPLPDVTLKSLPGTNISWHKRFVDIPEYDGEPVLVIAQEFFDALPVYQLELTERGWRERLVEIDDAPDTPDWFRTTLAPTTTPACALVELHEQPGQPGIHTGMCVEKCAEGMAHSQLIAERILRSGGAALFVDYGYEQAQGWSIRGIKDHQFVSIYHQPGRTDLSINVDFAALTRAAFRATPTNPPSNAPSSNTGKKANVDKLCVYGTLTQGDFLARLGIDARIATLLRKTTREDDAEMLIAAFNRLTDKKQMGHTYKVLGMFSSPDLVPEGFEGVEPKTHKDFHFPTTGPTGLRKDAS